MKNTTRFALLANWFLGCLAIIYFGYQNLEEQRENFQITDTRSSEGYLQQLRTSLNLVVNSELKLLRVISDKIIKGTSYSTLSAELKDFYTGSGKKIILVDELSHVDILYDIDSSSLSLEEFTQLDKAGVIQMRVLPNAGMEGTAEFVFNHVNQMIQKYPQDPSHHY